MRGGGRPCFGAPRMPHGGNKPSSGAHPGFDQQGSESGFQRVYPLPDEKALTEALLQRNQEVTPTPSDQAYVSALMSKINSQLEAIVLNPASFEPAQIEEIKQVGSYKTQTMVAGHNIADLVIVFRTLPTKEAVTALCNKLLNDYRTANRNEWVQSNVTNEGFDFQTRQASLKCLVATIPVNLRLLDDSVHLPTRDLVERHLGAVRHVKWFDENANNASVRALIRILRDMRRRFSGFTALNSWMIELLSHHAFSSTGKPATGPTGDSTTTTTPTTGSLALAPAFKRCLQLLAGGIFLPGAAGISDPCQILLAPSMGAPVGSVHEALSFEEMDQITYTAQTLLRVNSHGGCRHVLGLEGDASIAVDMSIFSTIVVTASEAAYDSQEQLQWQHEDEQRYSALCGSTPGGEGQEVKTGEGDVVMADEGEDSNGSSDNMAMMSEQEREQVMEAQVEQFMALINNNGSNNNNNVDLMAAGDVSDVLVKHEN